MDAGQTKKTVDIRREMKQCPACGQRFSRDAAFCPFDGTKLEVATYDPLADPLIGATIDGRYEVLELLGEGGMGMVYRVRHAALGREFALKALRRDLARDEELSARFIQEAKATAAVRHPNVVAITDFGHLPDGVPYFVMELLVGETLAHVIKAGGPLPAGRAMRIVQQVAAGLGAAHRAGVVHRDLKPENVFLVGGVDGGVASDDVRVVDFGAAKIIGSSRVTRQGIVFGTPHYMSPEQASGEPVDHRADIYALGVIMYEMFTGRVPFEADTYMGVLTQHMFVQPVPPSQIAPGAKELGALEEITLVCLAKKPEERFATMEAVSEAIASVVRVGEQGAPQVAPHLEPRPSRTPPPPRYRMADELEPPSLAEMRVAIDGVLPVPRRALPWGWIVAGAAVLVAAGVGWAWLGRPASSDASKAPASAASVRSAALATVTAPPPPSPMQAAPAPTGTSPDMPSASATSEAAHASPVRPPPRRPPPRQAPPAGIDDIGDPFAAPGR